MLKVPQIMHSQASDGEALGQMRAHRLYPLAQTGTELKQLGPMGRGHPFTWSSDDKDPMALDDQAADVDGLLRFLEARCAGP